MPFPLFAFLAIVVLITGYTGIMPVELIGAIATVFTLGIIMGEVGDRLPIWNKYCGGGAILAFILSSLFTYYGVFPKPFIDNINGWMKTYSFLNVFIILLIVGSILGINRKMLIRSFGLYIPVILAGVVTSAELGCLAGSLFGMPPKMVIASFVLPIMGGGAGAGAIPLAQIYGEISGQDPSSYLAFALAILAIGNILSVAFAVVVDVVGRLRPGWTGNGELMRDASRAAAEEKDAKIDVTIHEIGAAIFMCAGFFMFATLVSKKILPTIFGTPIHAFAYLIIFVVLANAFNIIPADLKAGAQRLQVFCGSKLMWIMMVASSTALVDFSEILKVMSLPNFIIAFAVVLGGVIGSAFFGWLVGFYPVESALTAGLCMSNMGGAGDLAVLGAAKRMNLMSYAQISSRIGGAIILLIGSFFFGFTQ